MPDSVLHVVGYLGYTPAERLLWSYIEQPDPDGGYPTFGVPEACLGLLRLPCRDLRDEIGQALERHVGAVLFPEFPPVLAAKTGDPFWLDRLVTWGEDVASTDCNSGLILGIALFGGPARAEFTRLLWNPRWEADATATGAARVRSGGRDRLRPGRSDDAPSARLRAPATSGHRGRAAVTPARRMD